MLKSSVMRAVAVVLAFTVSTFGVFAQEAKPVFQAGAATSYLTALPCAGLAIFIYVIEAFVTLLQAYIFTFLSINFLWQAMHQEH